MRRPLVSRRVRSGSAMSSGTSSTPSSTGSSHRGPMMNAWGRPEVEDHRGDAARPPPTSGARVSLAVSRRPPDPGRLVFGGGVGHRRNVRPAPTASRGPSRTSRPTARRRGSVSASRHGTAVPAGVAQWLEPLPSKQAMRVRFPSPAPLRGRRRTPADRGLASTGAISRRTAVDTPDALPDPDRSLELALAVVGYQWAMRHDEFAVPDPIAGLERLRQRGRGVPRRAAPTVGAVPPRRPPRGAEPAGARRPR